MKSDLAHLQLNIEHINKVEEPSSTTKLLADQTLAAERLGEVTRRHQTLCSDVNSRAVNLELMGDTWKEFDCLAKNLKEWLTTESARVSAEEKNLNGSTVKNVLAACLVMMSFSCSIGWIRCKFVKGLKLQSKYRRLPLSLKNISLSYKMVKVVVFEF